MFLVRRIGRLNEAESRRVLVEPAERMGASFEEPALTHLVNISGRYPYFLQEFGSAIWRISPRSPFTGADARRAEAVGLAQLDAMFFAARWERVTPAEREYLGAMAEEVDEGSDLRPATGPDRLHRPRIRPVHRPSDGAGAGLIRV